jgi:deoxyribonuclease V
VAFEPERWPASEDELVAVQRRLADVAEAELRDRPWRMPPDPLVGGCFVAFERATTGPGRAGDRAWAGAVAWRPSATHAPGEVRFRRSDAALRGSRAGRWARQASDVEGRAVSTGRAGAAYRAGFLALREGPVLARVAERLLPTPDVVMVDATGADHVRRAGLAIHLGAVLGLPTVGVTRRPLLAGGSPPTPERGRTSPLVLGGEVVARWVCTRSGARPVVAHPGWRTGVDTAVEVVLLASTEAARTPVPLQEARRVAREARARSTRAAEGSASGLSPSG